MLEISAEAIVIMLEGNITICQHGGINSNINNNDCPKLSNMAPVPHVAT